MRTSRPEFAISWMAAHRECRQEIECLGTERFGLMRQRQDVREISFRISVALKGLNAALEIIGGAALAVVSPTFILRSVTLLTQDELVEDPRDFIATYFLHAATHLSLSGQRFVAVYLLSHGVIKFGLVWALLKHKLWAYPLSLIVFSAFIVYQLYRFTFTHGLGLIALSLFDLMVIWLIYLEYRALKRGRAGVSRV